LVGVVIDEPEPGSIEFIDDDDQIPDYRLPSKRRLDFLAIPHSALLKTQKFFSKSPVEDSLARSS